MDFPVYDIKNISQVGQDHFLVSRFAPYAQKHPNLHFPHRHNFYHLVLFTSGSGTHTIDFQTFAVKPFQIYFMVPGQVHSWNFAENTDGYVVNFSEAFFNGFLLRSNYLDGFFFFDGIAQNSVVEIPEVNHEKLTSLFEEMLSETANNKSFSSDYLRLLLLQVFILVSRSNSGQRTNPPQTYHDTVLKQFRQLIEKNYTTLRLPKEYAGLLNIVPNQLNSICNQLLGIPAGEVIRNRVVLEAKRLLVNLELTVTEIAYQLNFSDNSYFTKFFKKYTGETPEAFRKRALQTLTP